MDRNEPGPGWSWIRAGSVLALVGLLIILWPGRGLMPHPLPFPPADATWPIAPWAPLGYPLLTVGALIAIAGAIRAANQARVNRYRRVTKR